MTSSFELNQVTYLYRKTQVGLQELSASFSPGITGILGENGAGKTTLLKVLSGIYPTETGSLSFNRTILDTELKHSKYRESIGYIPQDPSWPGDVKVNDFLSYFSLLKGVNKRNLKAEIERVLTLVSCVGLEKRRLKELSGGQHRRIFLAAALLNDPQVLILDEPTVALDPRQRIKFRDLVATLSADKYIFWFTHIVDDLTYIASRIIILDEGYSIWNGSVADLEK